MISNYPRGFNGGVIINELLITNPAAKIFYVGNNPTLLPGEKGASDSTSAGTFYRPFSTVDYAIGRCSANRGDIILVRPQTDTTITADSGVDIDVAGVRIIGLGRGENRPTFTFTTDADADFKIAAADVLIANMVFKCNIASQAMMIEVSGKDAEIVNCDFREGSATGLNFVTLGVADNDADRAYIHDCKFYMPTAGNGDSAISFAKDHIGVVIERCQIYGDFDLAGISIPAGGNAQVDCTIRDCHITNLLTGQHAIEVNGTSSTGRIIDCQLVTDAIGTSIDAGGLESFNVLWHGGTDQQAAVSPIPAVDGSYNFIGFDDADNAASTSNVAADEDGSILERLEQLQEAINVGTGTSLPANTSIYDMTRAYGEGYLATKTTTTAASTGATTLFTVTGDVEVGVMGTVETTVTSSGSLTLEVGVASSTAGIIAQTAKTQLVQHRPWVDATTALIEGRPSFKVLVNGPDIIETVGTAGASAGSVKYYCWWRPLSSDGNVVAA